MRKMIKFPSIEQFRTIVSNVLRHFNFVGLDEDGEAIYDTTKPKPTLKFKGTVKLHGTNAAVSYNEDGGLWAQSRENIITPEKDNAGFAFFVESKKEAFKKFAQQIDSANLFDMRDNIVTIYGEWCGGNIQKGVGISNLPKSFFIFGVKVSPKELDAEGNPKPAYWVNYDYLKSPDDNIYNILDFPTYEIDIDFNMPQLVQNKLSELTLAVEEECPVAKAFGFSGIGEGIVWSTNLNGTVHRFKVKGEKHAGSSKVKTLANVDVEKLESVRDFIDYAVTQGRFNQGIENTFPNEEPINVKKMGDLIRWVVNDIIKEESDTLAKNGLEPKDVNSQVSGRVREMFFKLSVNA